MSAVATSARTSTAPASTYEPTAAHRRPLWVVYPLFFLSGCASLVCEVVWFKQLQFVLSSSTTAVSIVVACFFCGLALGSAFGGRLADRRPRLLRTYAALEFALAVTSLALTLVLARWETWVEWLAPWLRPGAPTSFPLVVLLSLAGLLIPTSLMGATLPILSRYLVRHHADLARRIGTLYGLNTLGAAAGCALVGFVLIGQVGVLGSALVATGIYALIGVIAFGLSGRENASDGAVVRESSAVAEKSDEGTGRATVLVAVFAASGFVAIAYEVLWFRILANFGTHSVYAFSSMLATYLLGLVAGAFVCARWIAPRKELHLAAFARVQLLTAVGAILSLALLGRSRNILTWLGRSLESVGLGPESSLGMIVPDVPLIGLTLIVLLVPATLIGISFPLATELTVARLSRVGSRVGLLYSLNTVGGVLGSLVTGFVCLPFLGSQWTFLLMVALNVVLFAALWATQPALRSRPALAREGVVAILALVGVFAYLGPNYLRDAQTRFTGATVRAFHEGADATFAVLAYDEPHTGPYQQLMVNGLSFANNSPPGRRYMSALAHLPTLLHPGTPRSAVVICIGTGTTIGCLTVHPTLEDIHAVDIAPDVYRFAPHFVPRNHDFSNSPKVRQVVADGRHYLLTSDQKFDVLTFEPPPPNDAGTVNLYSREFYRVAKRRMARGAVIAQWFPLDMPRKETARIMVKSMLDEFPHVQLWISNRKEGVAIASLDPLRIDPAELRRRMRHPGVAADMAGYGMAEPEQLLATFVAGREKLLDFVAGAPMLTDDWPRIEYFNFYPRGILTFDEILRHREPVEQYLTTAPTDPARLRRAHEVTEHIWYGFEADEDGDVVGARRRYEAALKLDPENRYVRYLLGDLDHRH